MRWDGRLVLTSTLVCALAFNLTFFIQELFLVIPKALTPGLHATLYHNNHNWTGTNPITPLLQGTGALADLISGLLFAGLLAWGKSRSSTRRLFVFWMAFQGLYQALSQIVIGAVLPGNDAGMAMTWLGFGDRAKLIAALSALAVMIVAGIGLARAFVGLIGTRADSGGFGARCLLVLQAATLPGFAAVALLIPFREPRNIIEVAVLPLIVMASGLIWIQAGAGFAPGATQQARRPLSLILPLTALLLLLAFFQLVLRKGVAFS